MFAVRDDGCGFDPENRPGMDKGHFGLQGIQERIERIGARGALLKTAELAELKTADLRALTAGP